MNLFLEKCSEFIKKNNFPVFSVSICETEKDPESVKFVPTNRCQDIYSVAKAFVVTAVGFAYEEGKLHLNDSVTSFLEKEINYSIDTRWNSVTVEDALLHKIGLDCGFLDIDALDARKFGKDYLRYMLTAPMSKEPGKDAVYTDAAFYLLSRVVEEVVGMSLLTYLWNKLFFPLGFSEVAWSCCPLGHTMGATGLYITTADMVKLGELYRLGGKWKGQRILSKEWTDIVLQKGFELHPTGFGDFIGKGGMYGQGLAFSAEQGFSVAWQAYGFADPYRLLEIFK